jgi:transposase
VGIDWAKENHQIAVMNADGKVVSEWRIDHNWKGFTLLHEQLTALAPVQINLERRDGLLVDWLVEQGYAVYVTPPRIAAKYRPRRSKDDQGDARVLAQLLQTENEEARPLIRHSAIVEELRQLVRALEQVQREVLRVGNRLREVLQLYYPTLVNLFSDVTTGIALSFLQAYPTPQQAQALSVGELETFLRQQRYSHLRRLDQLHQHLQRPVPQTPILGGYQQQALGLAAVLVTLNQQESQLRKALRQVFAQHEESAWWSALPGAGELTTPRMLAWFGDNRAALPSAEMLQATAGTVPVTRRSGKQERVHFRWMCHKGFRQALMDFARNSIQRSTWARGYFYSQIERGHSASRAYRALANRWARILWTIWQKREAYDELKHVANRAHNGRKAAS